MTTASPIIKQNKSTTTDKLNVYDQVTNIIIEQLEKGVVPWQKPWTEDNPLPLGLPKNLTTGNYYNGINIVLLWSSAMKNNFATDDWASFKQWQSKKESIRKGERGSLVVYYDTFEKEVEGEKVKIPFLKPYCVFNRSQLTSYTPPEAVNTQDDSAKPTLERIEAVDQFILNTGAIIGHEGDSAFYNRKEDTITMPPSDKFIDTQSCTATENYVATLFHELGHWTGAPNRLDRVKGKKFADQAYANEELIAEFTSAFLCAGFQMRTAEKGNHAGYIDHWLKVLREDNRCIVKASSDASKAVDYLYKLTNG
jgi:antirestriction protein ArdC